MRPPVLPGRAPNKTDGNDATLLKEQAAFHTAKHETRPQMPSRTRYVLCLTLRVRPNVPLTQQVPRALS
eukprot:14453676-Alexandrium_andersonii.AAC.1